MTACFVVPPVFGLQNFVQWGAMYDDRWCSVHQYESNPHVEGNDPRHEMIVVGRDTARVYSAPTHNRVSCLAWARTRCGSVTKEKWDVTWVEPELQGQRYLGERNACDGDMPELRYWFQYQDHEEE